MKEVGYVPGPGHIKYLGAITKGEQGNRKWTEWYVGRQSSIVVQCTKPNQIWYIFYVSNKKLHTLGSAPSRIKAEAIAEQIMKNANKIKSRKIYKPL